MGIFEGDLMVIGGGGGGGVGRAKIMATCISCSSEAIFVGFVGSKVSVFPLLPCLVFVIIFFQGFSGSRETIRRQDGLGDYGDQHVVGDGELGARIVFWVASIMLM